MPRQRRQASNANTTSERWLKGMALTPEQIQAIYAKRRTKGLYERYLAEFLESGENGVLVGEQWPDLKDKKAQTVKQGFEGATVDKKDRKAPEGSDQVDIIVDGENVYLLNRAVLGEQVAEAA
jgi:hypothetical protein